MYFSAKTLVFKNINHLNFRGFCTYRLEHGINTLDLWDLFDRLTVGSNQQFEVKVKVNFHLRTSHEGPEWDWRHGSTLFLTSALDAVGVRLHDNRPTPHTARPPGPANTLIKYFLL